MGSKKKHVYLENGALNLYADTHFIPDQKKVEMAQMIVSHLLQNKKEEGEIYILDAGIGHGGDMLIPLLEELKSTPNYKDFIVRVEGFDNSDRQLESLRDNLNKNGYVYINDINDKPKKDGEKWISKDKKVILEVHKFDIEKEVNFFAERGNKFDLILCTFLLHHLVNWREGFLKLLYTLKNGGSMVFAERIRDIEFLDGNFKKYREIIEQEKDNVKKNLYNFLFEYYKQKSQYFFWNPEIRATDYSTLYNFSSILFDNKLQREFSWEYKVKFSQLLEWIKEQAYSHFWVGITKSEGEKIIKDLINKYNIKEQDTIIKLQDGIRITLLDSKRAEVSDVNYWMTGPLWTKLGEATHEDFLEAIKELISILITHDFIMPIRTIYLSIHPWDIVENKWSDPFPIVVNKNAFEDPEEVRRMLKDYLLYLKYSQKISFSMLKFMFIDLDKKFQIEVCLERDDMDLKIEENEFGELSKISIILPAPKDEIIVKYDKNLLNKSVEKIGLRELKSDIALTYIKREDLESIEVKFEDASISDKEQIKKMLSDLKKYISALKDPNLLESLTKAMIGIRQFFLREHGNIYYFPSESLKIKADGEEIRKGFGGFILCERPSSKNGFMKVISENLDKNRYRLLENVCNLFFSRIGIVNWTNKAKYDMRKHALRSAVAAIMARNMSHNIGSHVLAYLQMEKIVELMARVMVKTNVNENIKNEMESICKTAIEIAELCSQIETSNSLKDKIQEIHNKLDNIKKRCNSLSC